MTDELWITLDPSLLVGIPEIDQQHRRIVHILNNLNAAVKQSGESAELTARLFDEMIDYVRFHFRNEERMMQQQGYADCAEHTAAHTRLLEEVLRLRADFVSGNEFGVLQALKDWVILHISSSDVRLAAFLGGAGRAPAGTTEHPVAR